MSRRRKPKIINPLFQNMFDHEMDPFWKNKFIEALYGNFPPKITFRNNILNFTKNNKRETVELLDKVDVFQNIEIYKGFITKHTCIKSRIEFKEDNRRNKEIELNTKSIEDYKWKEIKKKKIKEVLIWNYINRLNEQYKLNEEEKYKLFVIVQSNLILKKIGPNTIEYEEGEVKNISNLFFDELKREFTITGNYPKKKEAYNMDYSLLNIYDINKTISYSDKWKKYIDLFINKNESVYNTTTIESTTE